MAELRPFEQQEKDFLTAYYRSAIGLTVVDFKWREQIDMNGFCENCGAVLPNTGGCARSADGTHKPGGMESVEWFETMPVLVCRTPDGEIVELDISQDEEGNGKGFLFGLERPT